MKLFHEIFRPPSGVSEKLGALLESLHAELQREPKSLPSIKKALVGVLEFLCSPEGRTDANCRAVDSFLSRDEAWDAEALPGPYVDILADMCGALHDAIEAPDIAANFDSTPEQLLERTMRL